MSEIHTEGSTAGQLPENRESAVYTVLFLLRKWGILPTSVILEESGGIENYVRALKQESRELRSRVLESTTGMWPNVGKALEEDTFAQVLMDVQHQGELDPEKLFLKFSSPADYMKLIPADKAGQIILERVILNHGWFDSPKAHDFLKYVLRVVVNRPDMFPEPGVALVEALGWKPFIADERFALVIKGAIQPRSDDPTAPNDTRRVNLFKLVTPFVNDEAWLKRNFKRIAPGILWLLGKLLNLQPTDTAAPEVALELDDLALTGAPPASKAATDSGANRMPAPPPLPRGELKPAEEPQPAAGTPAADKAEEFEPERGPTGVG